MKVLKKIGITILCLLLICGIGIVCLFHNEYILEIIQKN